jgi:hypothetical protein
MNMSCPFNGAHPLGQKAKPNVSISPMNGSVPATPALLPASRISKAQMDRRMITLDSCNA